MPCAVCHVERDKMKYAIEVGTWNFVSHIWINSEEKYENIDDDSSPCKFM